MLRTLMVSTALLSLTACGGTSTGGGTMPTGSGDALVIGGDEANFGRHTLTTGFVPDPATYDVLSGGGLDAADGGTDGGCSGWVTAVPDVIIDFTEMSGFLRFAFRAANDGEDATLVINDGNGNWHCNDDGVGLNPVVDLADAPPGQYDIWVGSYQAGANIQGQLMVTEIDSVTP